MNHRTNARFWRCYRELPKETRDLADRNYAILKADPSHRSLHLKKIGEVWSARVGLHHRALATESDTDLVWFWIRTACGYARRAGAPFRLGFVSRAPRRLQRLGSRLSANELVAAERQVVRHLILLSK